MKVFENLGVFAAAQGSQFGQPNGSRSARTASTCLPTPLTTISGFTSIPRRRPTDLREHHRARPADAVAAPHFSHQLYRVDNIAMAINYGYNKVRFITPVKVGANVRARGELTSVNRLEGAVQATTTITVEIEGSEKPAAVAESIVRFIG